MSAPQLIVIGLYAFNVGFALAKHGQARTDKHSFPLTVISTAISYWLLHWGGFFSGGAA